MWLFFLPNLYYEAAVFFAAVIPACAIALLKYFKGLIRIDQRNNSAYPTIFWAFLAPSCGLLLRGLIDFEVFDNANSWLPAGVIALLYLINLFAGKTKKQMNGSYLSIILVGLLMFGYGFGLVRIMNCRLDKSNEIRYQARVVKKRVSSGKHTTYYLELSPWGTLKENGEVAVGKKFYNSTNENDTVVVHFKKGEFDIPWYYISH